MRNDTPHKVSLIWPTRKRLELCKNCITSFYNKAKFPDQIETIMVADYDDPTINDLLNFIKDTKFDIKTILRHRSPYLSRDYINLMSQCSTGNFIWVLNDECEATTDNWDEILNVGAETFLQDKPDRLMYVLVDDDTHPRHVSDNYGCCFPIVSKEFLDCANTFIPSLIVNQGGDVAIFKIFQKFAGDRILDLRGKIGTLHHCHHNSKRDKDDTWNEMYATARALNKSFLNDTEENFYRDKLSEYRAKFVS